MINKKSVVNQIICYTEDNFGQQMSGLLKLGKVGE